MSGKQAGQSAGRAQGRARGSRAPGTSRRVTPLAAGREPARVGIGICYCVEIGQAGSTEYEQAGRYCIYRWMAG